MFWSRLCFLSSRSELVARARPAPVGRCSRTRVRGACGCSPPHESQRRRPSPAAGPGRRRRRPRELQKPGECEFTGHDWNHPVPMRELHSPRVFPRSTHAADEATNLLQVEFIRGHLSIACSKTSWLRTIQRTGRTVHRRSRGSRRPPPQRRGRVRREGQDAGRLIPGRKQPPIRLDCGCYGREQQ